ncbi:TetR/AcrR family transcriptional regulator [Saccharothrix variisporea]|uniref:TetR family transcriptional regulator n=1 Tax=Saccharothrix variisporea TaxID=543527 RepID=A0A495XLL3_9PSEU|nr:TetR/AcrR family transcriptional regulator [Saccharothrix variisporea]RKT74772.1 TetR family transcriptional regulator [Saccharothrix variisporea]
MPAPRSDSAEPATRTERRKALTRRKLIDAARRILAGDTHSTASIQDITDAADVGFGSFYNHFSSKAELFETAVSEVLEELGQLLDELSTTVDDPAVAFAQSLRLATRHGISLPETAQVLVRHGMAYIDADAGLAPRALRDIEAGVASGRFLVRDTRLALATTAGALLAVLHLSLTHPDAVTDATCDEAAEQLLRMLGVPPEEAHEIATAPLPALDQG